MPLTIVATETIGLGEGRVVRLGLTIVAVEMTVVGDDRAVRPAIPQYLRAVRQRVLGSVSP